MTALSEKVSMEDFSTWVDNLSLDGLVKLAIKQQIEIRDQELKSLRRKLKRALRKD